MEAAEPLVTRDALRDFYPDGPAGIRLALLPDQRCVYVKNAKVATSTIILWLHRIYLDDPDYLPEVNIHGRGYRLPKPNEVGWRRTVSMLRGSAYRFSFVRDPIRRLESAYLNKVADLAGVDVWRIRLRKQLGLPPGPKEPITFDQFVGAIEDREPIDLDPHWRPQHLNLMWPLLSYDHIGRMENFDTDLEAIREAAGLPAMPVDYRNWSTRPTTGSLFDGHPALLRRVRDIYAKDFELYGY